MQEFFLKHKKRIIGAGIAILVLVTVIASGIKLNATLLESAIGVVVTPFQDLTTGISSWIDDTVTSARNKTKLKDENEELKQQIAEMEATVRQGEADSQENVFLRDLLDLRKQRRDLSDFETAPGKLWSTNIFGKSLNELVREGVQAKLLHMPQEARARLQQTLERIINEGCDGLICILL